MENRIGYFGTDLSSAGHYFWDLEGESIGNMSLDFKRYPFDPETILSKGIRKGTVEYFHVGDYSICAIEGSCKDTRPGTKSVFFIKESLSNDEIVQRIKSVPIAVRIIQQMPFKVNF